jgi:hypothetical protein
MSSHDQPVLHDRDGSHPTLAGSFLAACAAFAVLLGRSPAKVDAPVEGLMSADANRLAAAAAASVAAFDRRVSG